MVNDPAGYSTRTRDEHIEKRDDISKLDVEELVLRRAIKENHSLIEVIEYENEVRWRRGKLGSLLWFDALVWLLDERGVPFTKGMIDLLPYQPRGGQMRLIEEKQDYCAHNNMPLLQTPATELTEFRIKMWVWKERGRREREDEQTDAGR